MKINEILTEQELQELNWNNKTTIKESELLTDDRESMLSRLNKIDPNWTIDEMESGFDDLCSHPEMTFDWREAIHNLIMKAATTYEIDFWQIPDVKSDPDRVDLLHEYYELAEKMRVYYALTRTQY